MTEEITKIQKKETYQLNDGWISDLNDVEFFEITYPRTVLEFLNYFFWNLWHFAYSKSYYG